MFFSIVETGKEFLEWLGFAPIKVEESNKAVGKSNKKAVEEAKGAAMSKLKLNKVKLILKPMKTKSK
ncbi:hypothetical protein QQ054_26345 [Oscillatoria amoena NRMC-F 0135]|nr:hypothetical protein [Oscillatoria amoena NRMC-F 0135]